MTFLMTKLLPQSASQPAKLGWPTGRLLCLSRCPYDSISFTRWQYRSARLLQPILPATMRRIDSLSGYLINKTRAKDQCQICTIINGSFYAAF